LNLGCDESVSNFFEMSTNSHPIVANFGEV